MGRRSPSWPRDPALSPCGWTWGRQSKRRGNAGAGIPAPSSRTRTSAPPSTRSSRTSMRPPAGVNFTALESRIVTTCCRRSGSPHTGAAAGSRAACHRRSLASAAARAGPRAASTTRTRSTRPRISRRRPERMRAASIRSAMISACRRALRSIVSTARAEVAASSSPVRSRLTQPRMAVRGVRNAWAAVESISSRARQARSASARACSSRSTSRRFSGSRPDFPRSLETAGPASSSLRIAFVASRPAYRRGAGTRNTRQQPGIHFAISRPAPAGREFLVSASGGNVRRWLVRTAKERFTSCSGGASRRE